MPQNVPDDALDVSLYTASGGRIRPFDPDPEDVQLDDVAHALSNVCRFSGQTDQFYSVALHSIYVTEELAHRGAGPQRQLYGLLHDASEAYISDLAGPLKTHVEPYRIAEARLMDAVWETVGLPPLGGEDADAVHRADMALREYEIEALLPVEDGDPGRVATRYDLRADDAVDVRAEFLDRAKRLTERAETDRR